MATGEGDASQPASPRRRRQAREQGHVARSRELVQAITFGAAIGAAVFQGPNWWRLAQTRLAECLQEAGQVTTTADLIASSISALTLDAATILAPWFLCICVAAIFGHFVQQGTLWLPEKVVPDASRIHPGNALARWTRGGGFGKACIATMKVVLICTIAYHLLYDQHAVICGWLQGSVHEISAQSGQLMLRLGAWIGLGLLISGALDYALQLWRYERELKMTPDELREEVKAIRNDVSVFKRRR